jgi:hypothetical protein
MARPVKTIDEALTEVIVTRVTVSERQQIEKRALNANLTVSAFVRKSALKGTVLPVDKIRPQLLAELGRVGNNINQIAHKANATGKGIRLNAREYKIIEEMREILRQVSESFVK